MSSPEDLVTVCRSLYDAIDRLDQAAAETVGVSRNDLRALNLLERGPVAPGFMARELRLSSGAVTALIDRIEAKGLVRRRRDPKDRRGVLVEPTRRMFEELAPLYRGVADYLRALAADATWDGRLELFIDQLGQVTEAYEAVLDEPSGQEN